MYINQEIKLKVTHLRGDGYPEVKSPPYPDDCAYLGRRLLAVREL